MTGTVYLRGYEAPPFDRREILRYAGVRGEASELEELLQACLEELDGKLTYRVCYRELPVACRGEWLELGFARTTSADLKKNLSGCESIVLFAATVGLELDRLLARYAAVSPTKALLFQAIGAERIESLCHRFNREIAEEKAAEGFSTRPRFSPGYGDFPLDVQKDIFAALDCPRRIGLSLTESLLMSPSKSVTALIGLSKQAERAREGCAECKKQDCEYRRTI